jgi:hypothetical protein
LIKVGKVKNAQDLKDALCMLYEDAWRLKMECVANGISGAIDTLKELEEVD